MKQTSKRADKSDKLTVDEFKALMKKKPGLIGRKSSDSTRKLFINTINFYFTELGYIPKKEHLFHPDRKWRFDLAFVEQKIAVEYEGIMSEKSRHTNVVGYTNDIEKYKAANDLGWTVLRYTVLNKSRAIQEIEEKLMQSKSK